MQKDIEIPARLGSIFSQKTRGIGLVNGVLQGFALANIFAANVDVTCVRIHRKRGNQRPFDQRVRIVAHNFAVFACARLGLVSIDDQIGRAPIAFFWHERPFQTRWKARATAATQSRCLHLINDPIAAIFDNIGRAIPMAPRLCTL